MGQEKYSVFDVAKHLRELWDSSSWDMKPEPFNCTDMEEVQRLWDNPKPFDLEEMIASVLRHEEEWQTNHPQPIIFCTKDQLPYYRKLFGIAEPGELSAKDEALVKRIYEET